MDSVTVQWKIMSTMPFSNTIMPKVIACRRETGYSSAEGKRFVPKTVAEMYSPLTVYIYCRMECIMSASLLNPMKQYEVGQQLDHKLDTSGIADQFHAGKQISLFSKVIRTVLGTSLPRIHLRTNGFFPGDKVASV